MIVLTIELAERLAPLHEVAFSNIHGAGMHRACNEECQEHGGVEVSCFELHDWYLLWRMRVCCWLAQSMAGLCPSYTRPTSSLGMIKRFHRLTQGLALSVKIGGTHVGCSPMFSIDCFHRIAQSVTGTQPMHIFQLCIMQTVVVHFSL